MNLLSLSDPQVASMPIKECGEPMLAIDGLHPRLTVDDSMANIAELGYTPTFVVREAVARRLVDATESVPSHFRLLIKESLRPASL